MKIGIFTECYKPILNGVVNSIIGFKQGLEQLGNDVYIFCPEYKNHKPEKNVIYCKSWPLPGKSGYHYIFPIDNNIKKIAKKMDIIHVQHPFIMGDRAAKVSKEFNIPLVFTNHTQYDQYAHYIPISKKFVTKSIINYIKNFTKKVDLIVAPAQGIEKKLRKFGVSTPIVIVPNGIDVKRFSKKIQQKNKEELLNKYNFKKDDKILIYTGRIAEEKNLTFLINSFKLVLKKIPNSKLLLVGGGVELEKFNQFISKENLTHQVIITDFISYKDMQDYLSIAEFYVTASKSEVHPLTLLEAMAQGLPCVIVKAPGTGDIVTNNFDGLITKDNIADFSNTIIKLLENSKLKIKLSQGAKKTSKIMLNTYSKAIEIHNKKLGG